MCDDNEKKYNKFTPGNHIPIYNPEIIIKEMPDNVIVLAWLYAVPIILNNKKYIENGGKFIVPLPNIKQYDISNFEEIHNFWN